MTTVTGLTKARMLAIEAASIVDGEVVGDDLILTKQSGATVNAGNVRGPAGPTAPNLITNAMLNTAAGEPGADGATSPFTPAITIGGTPITYGTGATRTGEKILQGKMCHVAGNIVLGTAPSFGAGGNFEFSLPHPVASKPTLLAVGTLRITGLTGSVMAYFNGIILSGSVFGVRYASTWPSSATENRVSSTLPAVPIAGTRYEYAVIYEID